ncbi:MAG TPA: DUF2948 family protein [Methylovirgula sp.]
MSKPLRLIALDDEDLAVLSAHLQDAVVKVRDMVFLQKARRFVLLAARFDWAGVDKGQKQRCYCGLHFEGVSKVAVQGFDQNAGNTCLALLSVVFEPEAPPGGRVVLTFSGGAAVRLDVECLEAQMRDLSPPWPAKAKPGHAVEADECA